MSNKLHVKQGWLRALVFFFVGMVLSGLLASIIVSVIMSGFFGGALIKTNSIPNTMILYCLDKIGILFCLWYFRHVIDELTVTSLGFSWKGFGKDALLGSFVAVLTIAVGTFLLYLGNNLTIRVDNFDLSNTLYAILFFIIVAFVEEVIVRGYILNSLMESMNRWLALFISAIIFTLWHLANPGITLMAELNIFIAGVLLGVNYIYTKNLWFAIFFHFAWNFFQGTILGYHVSGLPIDTGFLQTITRGPEEITGGVFGFEGSVFAAFLQLIAIAALAIYYEKKYGKRLINVDKPIKNVIKVETITSDSIESTESV